MYPRKASKWHAELRRGQSQDKQSADADIILRQTTSTSLVNEHVWSKYNTPSYCAPQDGTRSWLTHLSISVFSAFITRFQHRRVLFSSFCTHLPPHIFLAIKHCSEIFFGRAYYNMLRSTNYIKTFLCCCYCGEVVGLFFSMLLCIT